jgi:hypothetical protein
VDVVDVDAPDERDPELVAPGGTNCPSWRAEPSSSIVHQTIPSEYQDEKS